MISSSDVSSISGLKYREMGRAAVLGRGLLQEI
jgi:hypothetical protein